MSQHKRKKGNQASPKWRSSKRLRLKNFWASCRHSGHWNLWKQRLRNHQARRNQAKRGLFWWIVLAIVSPDHVQRFDRNIGLMLARHWNRNRDMHQVTSCWKKDGREWRIDWVCCVNNHDHFIYCIFSGDLQANLSYQLEIYSLHSNVAWESPIKGR